MRKNTCGTERGSVFSLRIFTRILTELIGPDIDRVPDNGGALIFDLRARIAVPIRPVRTGFHEAK
jgi:hypothetical protein